MKIISCNVNGIRAAYKKGFLEWFIKYGADIVCLQEIKARREQLPSILSDPEGYYSYFNAASRKGYSGVAVYSKKKPEKINYKLGMERFDNEGRMLELEYSDFTLINLYLPHGGRQKENYNYKLMVYKNLLNYLNDIKNKRVVLIGDFNIAHREIDLARPKNNKNNTGFTFTEREQIDKLLNLGFADSFRLKNKDEGNYTWWPYAFNAKKRNIGWRVDYSFISHKVIPDLTSAFILNKVNISDHCPIGLEI